MNARSWGDFIAASQRDKLPLIAHPKQVYAEQRTQVIHKKLPKRPTDLNPVTAQYMDPVKDATLRQQAAEIGILRSNVARDKQLKHMQSFNILSKAPVVQEPPVPPSREASQSFVSRFNYDVVSNEPLPPNRISVSAPKPREPRPLVNYAPSRMRIRPVDILSNKYKQDHEAKEERDAAAARQAALVRYWQTHNFDPIRCEYYDPDKEEEYQHTVKLSQAVQGRAQKARLPPSVAMTEGEAYDIVAHVPRDEVKLGHLDLIATRSVRWRTRAAVEENQAEAGDYEGQKATMMQLQRRRNARYEHLSDPHGFDILNGYSTNQVVVQRSQAGRPLTSWERIERDLLSPMTSAPAGMTGGMAADGAYGFGN